MDWDTFLQVYRSIIRKSCDKLKENSFACFVVGEVRDKNGNYVGLVSDTIKAFMDCGMKYYNEIILATSLAGCAIRANGQFKNNRKVVKCHQNILIFKK